MMHIYKAILCTAIVFITSNITNSYADNKTENLSEDVSSAKNIKKTNTIIPLKTLEKYLERNLKNKIIIGIDYANKDISVNLKKNPLNYNQLLAQLNINGFTAYRSEDYIQIIKVRDARNNSIPVIEQNKIYLPYEYVTGFLKTEKACTQNVLKTLRPLVPQYGHVSMYPNAHTIIIVDTYENVQRVKAMIKEIEDGLSAPEDCEKVP